MVHKRTDAPSCQWELKPLNQTGNLQTLLRAAVVVWTKLLFSLRLRYMSVAALLV